MKLPYYLLASALCLAVAIGACSDGPTEVADEAALSVGDSALDKGQPKVDICHWDGDANGGVGAHIRLNVNGNAWDGDGEGCGGKENGRGNQTGHNGHEFDLNWTEIFDNPATQCAVFCYYDSDSDGWTDDVDLCEGFDDNANADGDAVPDGCDACPSEYGTLSDGCPDTCGPSLGGTSACVSGG